MSDLRNFSRAFLREFIALYRSHDCLWKTKSKSYSDRDLKRSAYRKLVEKLKEVDPEANREAAVKKINNLRSAHRKELKKVTDSKRSADQNPYTPRLWYFNLLSFLVDQENSRASVSDWDRLGDREAKESTDLDPSHDQDSKEPPKEEPSPAPPVQSAQSHNTPEEARPQKRLNEEPTNQALILMAERLHGNEAEDDSDITGRHIASKLRILSQGQRIYAERLIAEVLFEAQLGNLSRECRLLVKNNRSLVENPT
ncbi:uncharacterized protein LOC122263720 [Penaeus japonicus]|uniref:uncharacterized protein LOC122263720 n=1 Tax=Penaeus japonicus TaxID=27405 RepID=UPI001C7119E1|nr:uncharacterized protein LOC122263720 [Penaeus japonicus]